MQKQFPLNLLVWGASWTYVVMLVLLTMPAIGWAQSSNPIQLDDCTPETEAFVAKRQEAIQREAAALLNLPEAGVYHASDEGGNEWLLIWAPNAGFIAYFIPDAPCPARVSYGTVRFERGQLLLTPQIPLHPRLKYIFGQHYRVITYRKRRYLVFPARVQAFYKVQRSRGDPLLKPPFLAQQEYSDSFWRRDPLRPK